jgi:hypothetical protein
VSSGSFTAKKPATFRLQGLQHSRHSGGRGPEMDLQGTEKHKASTKIRCVHTTARIVPSSPSRISTTCTPKRNAICGTRSGMYRNQSAATPGRSPCRCSFSRHASVRTPQ